MQCLNCGKKVSDYASQRYFVNPQPMIVATSYFLCDDHIDLTYNFDDIYEIINGIPVRREIDHNAISQRKESENP